jgi:hypothetical protein
MKISLHYEGDYQFYLGTGDFLVQPTDQRYIHSNVGSLWTPSLKGINKTLTSTKMSYGIVC